MPREYAQVAVRIWTDAQFCALPAGAQWLYLLLISQPDIDHLGVIQLRERRWANCAAGATAADISEYLHELEVVGLVEIREIQQEVRVEMSIGGARVTRVSRAKIMNRKPIHPGLRKSILKPGTICVTCGTDKDLTLDHIVPWSEGGSDERDNLQPMCRPCNSRKGARV